MWELPGDLFLFLPDLHELSQETWSVFQTIQGSFGKILSSREGGNKLKPPEE